VSRLTFVQEKYMLIIHKKRFCVSYLKLSGWLQICNLIGTTKTELKGETHFGKDYFNLGRADMSLFQQDLTDETMIHAAQILIELDGHRLLELGCGYEAHSYGNYAETLFKQVIWHW
jgi:hypothetical protein